MKAKSEILYYIYQREGACVSDVMDEFCCSKAAAEKALGDCAADGTLTKTGDVYKFVGDADLLFRRYKVEKALREHEFGVRCREIIKADYARWLYETTTEEGRKTAKERKEREMRACTGVLNSSKNKASDDVCPMQGEGCNADEDDGLEEADLFLRIDEDLSRSILTAAQKSIRINKEGGSYFLEIYGLTFDGAGMKFDLLEGKNLYLSDCGMLSHALKHSGIAADGIKDRVTALAEKNGMLFFEDHLCVEIPSTDRMLAAAVRLCAVIQYSLADAGIFML